MTYDRPPVYVPATPEFILEVIRDSHRQQSHFDPEADPYAELSFETTVDVWRDACDLVDAKELGWAMNRVWDLDFADRVWRGVLEPARERKLRGVCELIASQARRPTIEPLRILGSTCLPAAAFLAIRSLLREAGADVGSVMPSTPLEEYTRSYPMVFFGPVSRLAPNVLPTVRVNTAGYEVACIAGLFLGLPIALGGLVFSSAPVAIAGAVLTLVSWLGGWFTVWQSYRHPASVEFGSLRTFRDMAMVVAEGVQSIERIRPG